MKRQVLGAAFILLVGLSMAGWAVQYPVTISGIDIEGTVEIKDRDVLEVIGFEVGDEVSQSDLRAASQAVFDLGWFSEVAPEVGEGGEIVFHVVENPLVDDIVITGNVNRRTYSLFGVELFELRIMSTSVVRRILRQNDVRKGKVLNRVGLETALSEVITEYNDRGYVLVALGDVELGETLRIEIVEAHVAANVISGLETVPTEVAEELIDVPLGEPLRRIDVQTVLSSLRQSVYFANVEVVPQPGPEPDSAILEWNLEERDLIRESVRLEGIVLRGISCYEEETVYAELGEIPAEAIDNYGLLRILEGVYDLYSDAGYMMVRFAVEGVDDGKLHIRVEEGRVSEIVLGGTERTKDYVILRKLDIEVGRILNRASYLVSRQQLTSLGYFTSVDLAPEWVDDGVRVTVTVNEKTRLGGFEGSMSVDPSGGGIVGELSLHQKNLFGTGQDIDLSYSRGLTDGEEPSASVWNLGYSSVAFFPGFDRVGFDVYRARNEIITSEETFVAVTLGGGVSFSHPLDDYLDLGLGYKHEEERITGTSAWVPTDSFTVSLVYDDIADPWFPTQGSRRVLSFEKAGGFSHSREYANIGLTWTQFNPSALPFLGSVAQAVGIRVKIGWGDDLLPFSRYHELGGLSSVRGASPTAVLRMMLLNAEYRVELVEEALTISGFFDSGVDLDSVSMGTILASTGLELGVAVAGMFVRLDLAWVLSSEWSWTPRFEFGFSRMF